MAIQGGNPFPGEVKPSWKGLDNCDKAKVVLRIVAVAVVVLAMVAVIAAMIALAVFSPAFWGVAVIVIPACTLAAVWAIYSASEQLSLIL